MLRIIVIALGVAIVGHALLWIGRRSWPIIAIPLRIAVGLAAILMALIGLRSFENELGGPVSLVAVGALMLLLAGHLAWRLLIGPSRTRRPHVPVSVPTVPSTLPDDEWTQFLRSLGWLRRQRAISCRARIRAFLAEAGECDPGSQYLQLVIALERRLPDLLREWERCVSGATPGKRRSYSERTLAILEKLAAEADSARQDLRQDGDRAFDTLERYFSNFSRPD